MDAVIGDVKGSWMSDWGEVRKHVGGVTRIPGEVDASRALIPESVTHCDVVRSQGLVAHVGARG